MKLAKVCATCLAAAFCLVVCDPQTALGLAGACTTVTECTATCMGSCTDCNNICPSTCQQCRNYCANYPTECRGHVLTVYRPSSGRWHAITADRDTSNYYPYVWGIGNYVPFRNDYNGDGDIDDVVWGPATGYWHICTSGTDPRFGNPVCVTYSHTHFGLNGDYPVSGDFDGDGTADLATWRPIAVFDGDTIEIGTWRISRSSDDNIFTMQWGLDGDLPIVGNYDGDTISDIAVWRNATGTYYITQSSQNFSTAAENVIVRQWGLPGDRPMSGDYTGDGKTDLVVWRPSNGTWYVCSSNTDFDCNQGTVVQWGLPTDIPIQLDYEKMELLTLSYGDHS